MTDKDDVRKVGEQDEEASLFSLNELDVAPSSPSLAGEASEPRGAFDSLLQMGECGGIAATSESSRPPPPPPPPSKPPPSDKPSWLGASLNPSPEAPARNQPSLNPVALPGPESVHPEPPAAARWPRRNGDQAAIVVAATLLLVAVAFIAQPADDLHSGQAANPPGEATAFGAHVTAMTQAIVEVEEATPKPEPVVASVEDASDEEPPMDGTGERVAAPSDAEADSDGDNKLRGAEDTTASKSASSADGEFNRDAARSAMFAAASRASGCRSKKAKGRSRANVTIAPSGSVSNVSISGPAAGTKAGRCAAAAFRSVRVPPFSGSSVTLGKSFRIRK